MGIEYKRDSFAGQSRNPASGRPAPGRRKAAFAAAAGFSGGVLLACFLFVSLACRPSGLANEKITGRSNEASPTNTAAKATPPTGTLTPVLIWKTADGKEGRKSFGPIRLRDLHARGLWVAYERVGQQYYAGLYLGKRFQRLPKPVNQLDSLRLRIMVKTAVGSLSVERRLLKTSDLSAKQIQQLPKIVHHLMVLRDKVSHSKQGLSPTVPELPETCKSWREPFAWSQKIALDYATHSDKKTRALETTFRVKAGYRQPRLLFVSGCVAPRKTGNILLGNARTVKTPCFSFDVLHDEIDASGDAPRAFQVARSLYNDVLEGLVIYAEDPLRKRVLTATVVFSQMRQNIASRKSKNRLFRVTSSTKTWPRMVPGDIKQSINAFLSTHRAWEVLIPSQPVTFYPFGPHTEKSSFKQWAWYRVHPQSGRIIGMLRDGSHGAQRPGLAGVKGYAATLSGWWIAAAGVISGIPKVSSDMTPKEVTTFLALHSLKESEKYLEQHADVYDSYEAQLSFWMGAIVLPSLLGGKDAKKEMQDAGNRAFKQLLNKLADDAKKYVEDLVKEAGKSVLAARRDALSKFLAKGFDMVEKLTALADLARSAKELQEKVKARLSKAVREAR